MKTKLWISYLILCSVFLLFNLTSFSQETSEKTQKITSDQREQCINVLQDALENESGWNKIKAAEYLLELDYSEDVKQTIENSYCDLQYDTKLIIGYWMILAKATIHSSDEQDKWIEKIKSELDNPDPDYSEYAAESLVKLNYSFTEEEQQQYQVILGKTAIRDTLTGEIKKCILLADKGMIDDIPYLLKRLDEQDHHMRLEAANAILRIERRIPHKIHWLAWLIVGLYGIGMIGVGYYYMHRNKSADDYLLGGRTMKSWTVGLSLFATLLSTISYLATPGEMIENGPIFLSFIIAMPLVYYIIGWLFIPYIMRLKVTSAYELLENRFDSSIRTLSSLMFLSLRLLWMAVIIYATTDKVLIPIIGLDPAMTPWVVTILGIVTLLYTSMGGIRAVVITDAVQSFILFGGALLVMILITVQLGGVSEWWPKHWIAHWEPPRWGFSTSGERTVGWFIVAALTWWVCTTGSDQMSIQRFLSTRDVRSARKVLGTTLIANTVIKIFLGVLGLALLAYFKNNPHLLQDYQSISGNADQFLPQYISTSLPIWVSGFVIAGLMAAAMSSLSSGVNSSSAVITEDFVNRFRKKKITGKSKLRTVKIVSVCVGIIVVVMSLYVYIVPGNLFEITFRISNLLTAPLFLMFFLAMFIPWATVFGTWVATITSSLVAIGISFWENLFSTSGPSFLYIMPASLCVGIVIGMIISLLPIGPKSKSLISKIK